MQLEGLDHCGDDFGRGSDILADAELLDDQHFVAVLVSVVAHGSEDDAGDAILGGDLTHGCALHLHAVGGAFGLNGGFGGAVTHEQVAGGDLAHQSLDACIGAGFLGGSDENGVAGVPPQEGRALACPL